MDILEQRDEWLAAYRAGWLAQYKATGEFNWKIYNRPRNTVAPSGAAIDLSNSRLILITSAGGYLHDEQRPFAAEHPLGDTSIRLFPSATPFTDISYAHTHYDHTAIDQDPQVLVPLRHLEDMVTEGIIGELSPTVVSFMGYQPNAITLIDACIPAIMEAVSADKADAALLVPA